MAAPRTCLGDSTPATIALHDETLRNAWADLTCRELGGVAWQLTCLAHNRAAWADGGGPRRQGGLVAALPTANRAFQRLANRVLRRFGGWRSSGGVPEPHRGPREQGRRQRRAGPAGSANRRRVGGGRPHPLLQTAHAAMGAWDCQGYSGRARSRLTRMSRESQNSSRTSAGDALWGSEPGLATAGLRAAFSSTMALSRWRVALGKAVSTSCCEPHRCAARSQGPPASAVLADTRANLGLRLHRADRPGDPALARRVPETRTCGSASTSVTVVSSAAHPSTGFNVEHRRRRAQKPRWRRTL